MKQEFLLAEVFWFLDLRAARCGLHRFPPERVIFRRAFTRKIQSFSDVIQNAGKVY